MPTDSIGYPLPVFVKGFACLNESEMALAKKDIDPARPQTGPHGRDASSYTSIDPARLETAQKEAAQRSTQLVSYAPGTIRTAAVDTGTVYSVEA